MSEEKYRETVELLTKWYKESMKNFPPLKITRASYTDGTDSIVDRCFVVLIEYTFYKFLYDYKYEISYNQNCIAFFSAIRNLGKLEIV
jgi:hypothetical protein